MNKWRTFVACSCQFLPFILYTFKKLLRFCAAPYLNEPSRKCWKWLWLTCPDLFIYSHTVISHIIKSHVLLLFLILFPPLFLFNTGSISPHLHHPYPCFLIDGLMRYTRLLSFTMSRMKCCPICQTFILLWVEYDFFIIIIILL